jgi:hypothetical protein
VWLGIAASTYAKNRPQRVTVHAPAAAQTTEPTSLVPAQPASDTFEQLKKLAELKEQGILTDEEFQAEKAELLAT